MDGWFRGAWGWVGRREGRRAAVGSFVGGLGGEGWAAPTPTDESGTRVKGRRGVEGWTGIKMQHVSVLAVRSKVLGRQGRGRIVFSFFF
jgi:hypothetical protein